MTFAFFSIGSAAAGACFRNPFMLGLSVFFGGIAALGILWPIWRCREHQQMQFTQIRLLRRQFEGLQVPVSQAKRTIVLVGVIVLTAGCAWLLTDSDSKERGKAGLGLIVFSIFTVVWAGTAFRRTYGMLFTAEGIVWHRMFQAPAFLPWSAISEAAVFILREQYTAAPCLGLNVSDMSVVETSASNRTERTRARETEGWHFREHAETLLAPVGVIATAIDFYREHPDLRSELGTGTGVSRFEAFAEKLPSSFQVAGFATRPSPHKRYS